MTIESETIEDEFDADLLTTLAQQGSAKTESCYEETVLRRLARRELSAQSIETMMRHIAACGYCRRRYRKAEFVWRLMQQQVTQAGPVSSSTRRLPLFSSYLAVAASTSVLTALLVFISVRSGQQQSLASNERRHRQEQAQLEQQFAARERTLEEQAAEARKKNKQQIARLQSLNTDRQKQIDAALSALSAANRQKATADKAITDLQAKLHRSVAVQKTYPGRPDADPSSPLRYEQEKIEIACLTGRYDLPSGDVDGSRLRGVPAATPAYPIRLIDPVPVTDVRPALECVPLAGAAHYRVTLFDPMRPGDAIPTVVAVATTKWKVSPALKRGTTYRWQVAADRNGQEIQSVPLSFTVLPLPEANLVAAMRDRYAGAPLKLGLFYARHGFVAAAEQEWSKIPQHPLAAHWLKELKERQTP